MQNTKKSKNPEKLYKASSGIPMDTLRAMAELYSIVLHLGANKEWNENIQQVVLLANHARRQLASKIIDMFPEFDQKFTCVTLKHAPTALHLVSEILQSNIDDVRVLSAFGAVKELQTRLFTEATGIEMDIEGCFECLNEYMT